MVASGNNLSIDATRKIADESFNRDWPLIIKMDEVVKAKVEKYTNLQ